MIQKGIKLKIENSLHKFISLSFQVYLFDPYSKNTT